MLLCDSGGTTCQIACESISETELIQILLYSLVWHNSFTGEPRILPQTAATRNARLNSFCCILGAWLSAGFIREYRSSSFSIFHTNILMCPFNDIVSRAVLWSKRKRKDIIEYASRGGWIISFSSLKSFTLTLFPGAAESPPGFLTRTSASGSGHTHNSIDACTKKALKPRKLKLN